MAAADLIEAAGSAYVNLAILWNADTLKAKLTAFWTAISPSFLESMPNDRPIGDWISLIAALAADMPSSDVSYGGLDSAAQYVYRICWLTQQLRTDGLITAGQATAVLTAYNAQLSA